MGPFREGFLTGRVKKCEAGVFDGEPEPAILRRRFVRFHPLFIQLNHGESSSPLRHLPFGSGLERHLWRSP